MKLGSNAEGHDCFLASTADKLHAKLASCPEPAGGILGNPFWQMPAWEVTVLLLDDYQEQILLSAGSASLRFGHILCSGSLDKLVNHHSLRSLRQADQGRLRAKLCKVAKGIIWIACSVNAVDF